MTYDEFVTKLNRTDENGDIKIYVPETMDSRAALEGAMLNSVLQQEGIYADVKYITYKEPSIRMNESQESFEERYREFSHDIFEKNKNYVVIGEKGELSLTGMYETLKDNALQYMPDGFKERFIEPIEADMYQSPENRSDVSKLIESMNVTRKEALENTHDFNYWNTTNIMEQMIDVRMDRMSDPDLDLTELITSLEEDINSCRHEIPVEISSDDGIVQIAVDPLTAKNHFSEKTYGNSKENNTIIAVITEKEAKDIGIYDKIEPVIDGGGQEIYNSEGDNITMDIRQLTDSWARTQIDNAIQNAKSYNRGNVNFRIMSMEQVGGYYEDIVKATKGTDIVGYTYNQNNRFIYKPIQQDSFNLEIPEKWKEGILSDEVAQCNKNGLSVTFKSKEDFQMGIETMLDEMGIEAELDVDRYEEAEAETDAEEIENNSINDEELEEDYEEELI